LNVWGHLTSFTGSAFLLVSRSNAFVGHVAKVGTIQVGH